MHPDTCPHCGNDDKQKMVWHSSAGCRHNKYLNVYVCLVCGVLFTPDVMPATVTATTNNQAQEKGG